VFVRQNLGFAEEKKMQRVFAKIAEFSEKWPWLVLALVFIITAIAFQGVTRIESDFDFQAMLPEGQESVQVFDEIEDVFGGTLQEQVLLKSGNVIQADILRAVAGYQAFLEEHPEVWGKLVDNVSTPLDSMVLLTPEGQLQFDYFDRPVPLDPDELSDEEFVQQVELNLQRQKEASEGGFGAQLFISEDGEALLIELDQVVTNNDELATRFEDLTREYFQEEGVAEVFVTGTATWTRDSNEQVGKDTSMLFGLAMIFILIVLFLTFRRITDVLLTLSVVIVTIIWVMGLSGYVGIPFTYPSMGIMPLLLGLGIAYAIHVLSRYYEERRDGEGPALSVNISVTTVGVAVGLTAVTTAIGFASFSISEMPPMRDFGFLCLVGVLLAFVLAVTTLPAAVYLRDRKGKGKSKVRAVREKEEGKLSLVDRALVAVALVAEHHRAVVLIITAILVVFAIFAGVNLSTEAEFEGSLENVPAAIADKEIDNYFGGQVTAFTLVEGDGLSDPSVLQSMLEYEEALAGSGAVTEDGEPIFVRDKIFSIADLIASQNNNEIPDSREEVQEILAALTRRGGAQLINDDANAVIILSTMGSENQGDLELATEVLRQEDSVITEAHPGLTVGHSGEPVLISDVLGNLTPTMIKTSLLALLLCLLVVTIIFRSFFFGLAATSVVFLGLALELIALYALGWPLDFMTVMASALIIGAGIDFGIHVTHRFREEWELGCENVDEAVRKTVGNVGRALLSAAVTTAGAFGVLAFSQVQELKRFGGVTAIALISALLVALLVLPTILSLWAERAERKNNKAKECEVEAAGE
jgi:hydrophobe/amphiphile efflux-3 (HAE3) family protein